MTNIGNYEGALKIKECSTCLFTSDIAKIHEDGECNYCKLQKKLADQCKPGDWPDMLVDIKRMGRGRKYDCIIGISGGADSSVLLYLAVFVWRLRVFVLHMDNGWNGPEATHNLKMITDLCGVDFVTYRPAKKEYDDLNKAFLAAGLPDADIPNDIAMTKLTYEAALKNDIKYILAGHDFRNEGSTPRAWTYMDAKYIEDVYRTYNEDEIKSYPLLTFWDQIYYGIMGIKHVRPYWYHDHGYQNVMEIIKGAGWKPYGAKHAENVYTEFVGAWLLPNKFGIDKRRVYLSAQIREGYISKASAKEIIAKPMEFDFSKLGDQADEILRLAQSKIGDRKEYDHYNFKRYWPVIWLLAKLGVVPYTFYKKYCR